MLSENISIYMVISKLKRDNLHTERSGKEKAKKLLVSVFGVGLDFFQMLNLLHPLHVLNTVTQWFRMDTTLGGVKLSAAFEPGHMTSPFSSQLPWILCKLHYLLIS